VFGSVAPAEPLAALRLSGIGYVRYQSDSQADKLADKPTIY
jgi:hypothetical protein